VAAEETLMVVGGGKMGEALVGGLLRSGWVQPAGVTIVETDPDRRAQLGERYPGVHVIDTLERPSDGGGPPPGGAIVAVKPVDAEQACRFLQRLHPPRVLSIAAGVTLRSLESWLTPDGGTAEARPPAAVRAMPNTPALIGCGAAAIAGGRAAGPDDLTWAQSILEAVGTVVVVPEDALDAVTGLSGSGPAYVFLLVEALIDAGEQVGLARAEASQLVIQTLLGSARLLAETGDDPATLRAAVTSPGGTTAAGVEVLETQRLRYALADAVAAATRRSKELGQTD
jgi:pyrroline-5-carboxylate reductase